MMKWNDRLFQSVLAVFLITLLASGVALAQGGYNLSSGTVDGGGTIASTGPPYTLGGTIGQPDAGVMSNGDFTLGGGFWGGGELTLITPITPPELVYLPFIIKS